MDKGVLFPRSYKRGVGALDGIGEFCKDYGKRVLISGGHKALAAAADKVKASVEAAGLEVAEVYWYGGVCCWSNVDKLVAKVQETGADIIIACGGGNSIDTAKAASSKVGYIPVITVPTIAGTCAAMTGMSNINNEKGEYQENYNFSATPTAVFVDSEIIVNAPERWLYGGLGDTLAKLYEYRVSGSAVEQTARVVGAINNSQTCYDLIKMYGKGAKDAAVAKQVTPALEYAVDAIIYYAGMCSIWGGEKLRGAAAHCVYFGFTYIPEAHAWGHGLLVGFGNLCLLSLEKRPDEEIIEEIKLAIDCGVPVTLKQIADVNDEDLKLVAKVACAGVDMKNMPFEVTEQMVIDSIKHVDALSTALLAQ